MKANEKEGNMIKIICDKCNKDLAKDEVIVIESHLCKDCIKKMNQEAIKK